ncbi:putative damage-specific DNA binding protein 1 [Encephalitozoon hellem]|uniref:Damage-specific DNA binding protein 1 n=1 Tax=Encephalitozoon hellem TaxID=27973 RepID=A0ABY8CJC8_ENCHE|nr:putative damage-specific DNA binding protein 1 [Encephalitozoon hellem]
MIRSALFSGDILHMEFIECDLFMCVKDTLYILNMKGLIREDVILPSNGVKEILKFKDVVFLQIERYGYYYFKIGSPVLTKMEWRIEKMHVNANVIFSHKCTMSFLDSSTFQPRHIVTMPGKIIDFAEVGTDIYVLVDAHLCLIQGWRQNRGSVPIKFIEFLSHLKFISVTPGVLDLLILESNHEMVVYGKEVLKSIKKTSGYQGYRVFGALFILLLSDSIELYCLNTYKMFIRLYFTPRAITYDSCRGRLWVYSDSLYEIDISKLII